MPVLANASEAQGWVDARIAEGSDYIKIIYDDMTAYGRTTPGPTLSKDTVRALIAAAHKRGKLAVVHFGAEREAREAIEAGADGLMHLFVGEHTAPGFGQVAAAHHVFVVPTLSVLESICKTGFNAGIGRDSNLHSYIPPAEIQTLERGFPLSANLSCKAPVEAIQQLRGAGVPILVGSDAANPGTTQGATVHGEMELLVRAGMTPEEVLRGSTSDAARAFHLDDRGLIAPGRRADLVLVDGDPTADITATRKIVAVWENGHEIDRAAWRAEVVKLNAEVASQAAAPASAAPVPGLIASFDDGGEKPRSAFGAGWAVTTDRMAGGNSQAAMQLAAGGAEGSAGSLRVTGEVKQGFAFPWAGVLFSPGASPMAPADFSSKQRLRFWARGDAQTYEVMLFAKNLGYQPAIQTFVAGSEWKEITITLADFKGADLKTVLGLAWCAGPQPATFDFQLDNVRLE